MGSFPFVPPPPSLVSAYYLQPTDARAIFLHNELLCNDTCSVTRGSITYWWGTNGKDPKMLQSEQASCSVSRLFPGHYTSLSNSNPPPQKKYSSSLWYNYHDWGEGVKRYNTPKMGGGLV